LAKRAGGTGIYLLTGHGRKHRAELPDGVMIAEGIGEATERIIEALAPPA